MQNINHSLKLKMQMYSIIRVTILFIVIHKTYSSECICTENHQRAKCTNQAQNTQQNSKTSIDTNSSQNLPFHGIKSLTMQCNILTLQPIWFTNQGSLTDLDISGNSIVRIPSNLFTPFSNLETLILSHNQLRNPEREAFHGLQKLKILDISHNKISNIDTSVLDKMPKLEKLYANNNGMFSIWEDVFEALNDLMVLDLSHNHLKEISEGLFRQNEKLKELNLAGNNFNLIIPVEMFDDLKKITSLSLSACKIQLQSGVFDKTTKLVILDLSKNNLEKIPADIFIHLKDLRNLNLAECGLRNLPENLFKENSRLEELNLSNNNFRDLPDEMFSAAQNFKYLNFSKNLIRELSPQVFQYTSLVEIDLSNNLLTRISPEFLSIATLQNVHLQHNKIVHLNEVTAVVGSFPVKLLDLRNNKLVFLGNRFFKVMANLESLEIVGNPWDCTCFDDILKTLEEKDIKYTPGEYYEGTLPVCVVSDLEICNLDVKNLTHYYNVYHNIVV